MRLRSPASGFSSSSSLRTWRSRSPTPRTCSREAASATEAPRKRSGIALTCSTPPISPSRRSSTTRRRAEMRAAVTEGRRAMRVVDVPEPTAPGVGEVLVRPEAVGLCGSDFHYFLGDIADALGVELYPRVQGHEAAGMLEAVGPDCPSQLRPGQR